MVELFGRKRSRSKSMRTGALAQVAGVELLEYADGPERGVRVLDFRTGAGLSFRIAIDRGFDLLAADYPGVPIGWRSPTGPRHPASRRSRRTAAGASCARSPVCSRPAASIKRSRPRHQRGAVHLSGVQRERLSAARPDLAGAGASSGLRRALGGRRARSGPKARSLRWRCSARTWCSRGGSRLRSGTPPSPWRTGREPRLSPTPHMLLYHYNFGYPLLDDGAELGAEPGDRARNARRSARPGRRPSRPGRAEGRFQRAGVRARCGRRPGRHGFGPADQPGARRGGFGIRLDYDRAALPCLIQWQCLQSGLYVLGIEPSTNHVLGRKFAEERVS